MLQCSAQDFLKRRRTPEGCQVATRLLFRTVTIFLHLSDDAVKPWRLRPEFSKSTQNCHRVRVTSLAARYSEILGLLVPRRVGGPRKPSGSGRYPTCAPLLYPTVASSSFWRLQLPSPHPLRSLSRGQRVQHP